MTIRDLLLQCCQRLDHEQLTCPNTNQQQTGKTNAFILVIFFLFVNDFINVFRFYFILVPSTQIVCYKCALKTFKALAYQFRTSMKSGDILPTTMRQRENCYYGKQCRTQYNKIAHAQKLNHACEQTRFQ
jgi:hypothetical protein